MFRSIKVITVAIVLAIGAAPGAAAQMASPAIAVVAQGGDGGAASSVQAGGSGLPARTPPPRTMSDRWPVFVAFSIVWLALIGYTLSFNGRLKRIAAALSANEPRPGEHERSARR